MQPNHSRRLQAGASKMDAANATRQHRITAANINDESFYNLAQLCRLTGYADPLAAMVAVNAEWLVMKDFCGNIVSVSRMQVSKPAPTR